MKTKFILVVFAFYTTISHAELVERIAAIVNTEIVTLGEMRSFAKKVSQNGMIDDLLIFHQKPEVLKNSQKEQLNYLINEKILDSEIKRLNLSVTIEKVEQEIREIAKRNKVSRADLLEAIKGQGMSVSEYQNFIKTRIERQSLIESEVSSKIRVSDEDVLAEYQRSKTKNVSGGVYEYTLAHIFVNPKKGGVVRANDRITSALAKIRSGESFETVAEQFSEDPNFTTGGMLGTFKAGEFSTEMEQAVENLNVGDVSEPVKSKGGFHLLKVISKKIISDPAYEKEKESIRSALFEKAFQKNFKLWLEGKKEESFIRINITI